MKKRAEISFYIITAILIISGFSLPFFPEVILVKMLHKMAAVLFCIFLAGHAARRKRSRRKGNLADVS